MNRLQAELQRLFLRSGSDSESSGLGGADGQVRALVLQLARPASWDVLQRAWRGVQADLELPAPGIAVSGGDAYQLWFSLSEPVPVAQATAFLEALRARYLADVAQERISMHPADATRAGTPFPAPPPAQAAPERWSAFVTPDLAALFSDEPWLDLPPGDDAQADLLSRLASIGPEAFQRALERPGADAMPTQASPGPAVPDPRRFLLETMNDRSVALHLRIEAAKALLPWFENQRP